MRELENSFTASAACQSKVLKNAARRKDFQSRKLPHSVPSHLRQAGGCSWQVQSTEGGSTLLGLQFYGAPLLRCNLALIRSEVASKHGSEGSHFVGGGGCGKA